MAPVIRVDEEVMDELKNRAVKLSFVFGTPNDVLRAVLGLSNARGTLPPKLPKEVSRRAVDEDAQFPNSSDVGVQKLLDALQLPLLGLSPDGFGLSKHGVWIASSDNFVAIRVQDRRNRDLRITVYGRPEEFQGLCSQIALKPDMGGVYSRFNLSRTDLVPEALKIIQYACQLKQKRGRRRR